MKICVATVLLAVALLLGDSVQMGALVTGPAPNSDSDGSQGCPTCCQGPAASNGIPGLPGQHGQPGSKGDAGEPGQRGEVGPIGPMGEPGPAGNPGPKGDDGIGRPGKIGPRGLQGLVGAAGPAGVKGQKGEPGKTPDTSNQRVAFTAVRTSTSHDTRLPFQETEPLLPGTSFTSHDTRLPFQETETLLPGTSFDLQTGTFTCKVSGTYVFMFSVNKPSSSSPLYVYLRKNGDAVVTGLSNDSGNFEQVSGSAVLVLQPEDTVYLTMYGRAYSDSHRRTSFSGFLLYPA